MSYIASYVIPFLVPSLQNWQHGLALGIFFFILGVIHVNSNMIHINPMLNLQKYHLYEITTESGSTHALISRKRIQRGLRLEVIKVGDDILIEKMK